MSKQSKPAWMVAFHAEHGIWPIAGGDEVETPPAVENHIVVPDLDTVETTQDRAKEDRGTTLPEGEYFTKEDIARVRKEEKDKLYGRLSDMEAEVRALREADEAKRKQAEEEERAQVEQAQRQAEEEMSAKELLAKKEQEWQEQFNQLKTERERDLAILEKERELSALKEYKSKRLSEVDDSVMPHLRDLIDGNSPEEIDAAIEDMQRRTSSILEEVQSAMQSQRQQMVGTKPTAPGIGPVEENESAQKTFTPEQIKQMSPRDYAKYRDSLKAAVSDQVRARGLYGNR